MTEEVVTEEVVTEDLVTEDLATEDLATEDLATEDLATEDLATEDLATEGDDDAKGIGDRHWIVDRSDLAQLADCTEGNRAVAHGIRRAEQPSNSDTSVARRAHMHVRFWGVRGSIASSGSEVARIGGNTACVEVESQGQRLILDAGTGVRRLGDVLARGVTCEATFLFSHLHWDHVQGFPFFAPAWSPGSTLTLYGPGAGGDARLRQVLESQMQPPNFPVPLQAMRARMSFKAALPGAVIETGPFKVTPFELPHPQGCLGYRIEADGQSFAYCTDVELTRATMTGELHRALEGVGALAIDAQYTRAEYEGSTGSSRRGWGHSTNVDAAEIASSSDVGQLFLFHHDPAHHDDQVEAMAAEARTIFARSEPARESTLVNLEG